MEDRGAIALIARLQDGVSKQSFSFLEDTPSIEEEMRAVAKAAVALPLDISIYDYEDVLTSLGKDLERCWTFFREAREIRGSAFNHLLEIDLVDSTSCAAERLEITVSQRVWEDARVTAALNALVKLETLPATSKAALQLLLKELFQPDPDTISSKNDVNTKWSTLRKHNNDRRARYNEPGGLLNFGQQYKSVVKENLLPSLGHLVKKCRSLMEARARIFGLPLKPLPDFDCPEGDILGVIDGWFQTVVFELESWKNHEVDRAFEWSFGPWTPSSKPEWVGIAEPLKVTSSQGRIVSATLELRPSGSVNPNAMVCCSGEITIPAQKAGDPVLKTEGQWTPPKITLGSRIIGPGPQSGRDVTFNLTQQVKNFSLGDLWKINLKDTKEANIPGSPKPELFIIFQLVVREPIS